MRRRLSDVQIFFRSGLALFCTLIATAIAFCVPVIIGFILCHFLCGPGPNDFNGYWMGGFFIGLALGTIAALYGLFYVVRPWIYPYVPAKMGYCNRCDYDLRGLPESTTACPECGATITRV